MMAQIPEQIAQLLELGANRRDDLKIVRVQRNCSVGNLIVLSSLADPLLATSQVVTSKDSGALRGHLEEDKESHGSEEVVEVVVATW